MEAISQEAIAKLQETFKPPPPVSLPTNKSNTQKIDVPAYLAKYGREVVKIKQAGSSTLYCLKTCIFDSSHVKEAAIGQTSEGKLFYQCFHASCKNHTWHEARKIISGNEPLLEKKNYFTFIESNPKEKETYNLDSAIMDVAAFSQFDTPDTTCFLDPWLKENSINLLSGWRGTGKTWFALMVVDAVTKGETLGQWECEKPVPCLFLDGEMVVSDIQERIWDLNLDIKRKAPLYIYSDAFANQQGLPRAHLSSRDWQKAMKKILIDKGIKLFIIDNIASLAPGLDENSRKDWDPINQWLLELRFACISTILLHHTGKGGQQRGTSAREDNVDTSIMLKPPGNYSPEDGARFVCHFSKARVKTSQLSMIADTEFKLIQNEDGTIWTYGNVKRQHKKEVLKMISDGLSQKDIADDLGISKGYVSQIKKKAISDGHLTKKGELTQSGFAHLENDEI